MTIFLITGLKWVIDVWLITGSCVTVRHDTRRGSSVSRWGTRISRSVRCGRSSTRDCVLSCVGCSIRWSSTSRAWWQRSEQWQHQRQCQRRRNRGTLHPRPQHCKAHRTHEVRSPPPQHIQLNTITTWFYMPEARSKRFMIRCLIREGHLLNVHTAHPMITLHSEIVASYHSLGFMDYRIHSGVRCHWLFIVCLTLIWPDIACSTCIYIYIHSCIHFIETYQYFCRASTWFTKRWSWCKSSWNKHGAFWSSRSHR